MKYMNITQYANPDLGKLLLRVALALVFIAHGLDKIEGFGVSPGVVEWFGTLAFPVSLAPAFFTYLVTAVELMGGLALLLGIYAEIAALFLAVDMLFAIYLVKLPGAFMGGYEFELTLLLVALAVFFLGAGKYTVQKYLPR